MNPSQKVALITGAGRGIGKHAALGLLKAGYAVVFAGRNKDTLDAAIKESGAPADRAMAVSTDVGNYESVAALFVQTKAKFGRLDLLFNNAGAGTPAIPLEELTEQQWRSVIDVNLSGAFFCTQQAFKIMKDQDPRGGRIINNGSISAHVPRPLSAPYTATKHAMTGLTRSTSLDGRAYNIACGQIDIGNAATDLTERMTKGVLQPSGELMVEPRMELEHVTNAILYMASLPLEANVQFLTVMATNMPFIGRG